tara:strand:- start:97 stop:393 length:297 start_codon:yes stop_codon:yes gene_type:complete
MGWAPAVFGRFLKPGGRGGRPKLELAFPTMPLVRDRALYADPAGTLDDLHEAVTMHGETERIARRVLGGAHPLTTAIEDDLRKLRAALRDREASTGSA